MFKEVLTDPQKHNPSSFVYMVQGIVYPFTDDKLEKIRADVDEKMEVLRDPKKYFCASLIGNLNHQNSLRVFGHNGKISQVGTYGNIGLVIEPYEEEQIQIAHNCDMGSPSEQEIKREFVSKYKGRIQSPFDLLTKTVGNGTFYNELILQGHPKTKVGGIFFRPTSKEGEYLSEMLRDTVNRKLESKVPIVEIPLSVSQCDLKDIEFTRPKLLESGDEIWKSLKDFYKF